MAMAQAGENLWKLFHWKFLAIRVVVMVHHQAWPGMGLWGETDDGSDEVTSSSPCEVKMVKKKNQ